MSNQSNGTNTIEYGIKTINDFTQNRNNETNVNVVGINKNALTGIEAILNNHAVIMTQLQKGIATLNSEVIESNTESQKGLDLLETGEKTRHNDNIIRSVASERRQRAVNAAVFGKIDKAMSFFDKLKEMLSSLLNKTMSMIKEGFKKSINTFDSFSKDMRRINISHADKLAAQSSASSAKTEGTFRVSLSSIQTGLTNLAVSNNSYFQKLVNDNTKEATQRKNYIGKLTELGWDSDVIAKMMMSVSDNELSKLEELIYKASDPVAAQAIKESISNQLKNNFENFSGDFISGAEKIIDGARKLAATGVTLSPGSMSKLTDLTMSISSGNLQNVDTSVLSSALGIVGDKLNNPEVITNGIFSRLKEINDLQVAGRQKEADQLAKQFSSGLVYLKNSGADKELLNEMQISLEAAKKGNLALQELKSLDQLKEMNKDNTSEGKVANAFDNIVATINNFSSGLIDGGLIGSLSTNLDELFGGSVQTGDVVVDGFANVVSLLKSIRFTLLINSIVNFFKSGLGSKILSTLGIGTKATGAAGAAAKGATGAAAKGATGAAAKGAAGAAAKGAAGTAAKGAAGAAAVKGVGSALRGAKAIPIVGTVATLGLVAYDFYDASQYKPDKISTSYNSEEFKKEEKKLQRAQKEAKYVGTTVKAAGAVAGMAAGAKLGAAVGSIVPGLGTAVGLAVGAGVGAITGVVVDKFVKASQNLKNTVMHVKSADDLKKQIINLDKRIQVTTDETLKQQLIALRENTKAQYDSINKKIVDKEIAHWAEMTGGKTSQDVIDGLRDLMMQSEKGYDITGEKISAVKNQINEQTNRINQLSSSGASSNEIENAKSQLEIFKYNLKTLEAEQASYKETLVNSRLALNKSLDTDLVEEYESTDPLELASKVREDLGNKAFMWDRSSFVQQQIKDLTDQIDEGVGANEIAKHLAKLSPTQAYEVLYKKSIDAGLVSFEEIEESILSQMAEVERNQGTLGFNANQLMKSFLKIERERLKAEHEKNNRPVEISLTPNANGGIYDRFTPTVIGEAGKEAVVPLERPNEMKKVLSGLNHNEKLELIKALLTSRDGLSLESLGIALLKIIGIGKPAISTNEHMLPSSVIPGNDKDTIDKILSYAGPARSIVYDLLLHGWKGNYKDAFKQREKWYKEAVSNAANQEGRNLIAGTYAERALAFGVSELGKPYILNSLGRLGYVCNELVNACLKASGFDMGKFRVNGVRATFANIKKGKYSGENYPNFRIRNDLTPQTAIPGMVFFQDSRKNKEGGFQPGHIGLVYYGHQKLHSSGGAKDYSKSGFLRSWQTPCRGVTVTPFDNNSYVIGEFPGLFEKATGQWNPPVNSPVEFGPAVESSGSSVKKVGLLSDEDLANISREAGVQNAAAMADYIRQAETLLNSGKDKESIVAILLDIAKYLRGAVPSNKITNNIVSRPHIPVYG